MSYTLFMQLYSSQVFREKLGKRIEFIKKEKTERSEKKVSQEKIGDLELSVFRLAEKPLYELKISFNEDICKGTGEEYCIKDITEKEIGDICKQFKELYKKIKSRKGRRIGGGSSSSL